MPTMTTSKPLKPKGTKFKRGARPTPRHKLAGAMPFRPKATPPPKYAVVPQQLSYWDNDQDGDCVTAEEAYKCACDSPEDFIPDQEVTRWASSHGWLNGADLLEVMQAMQIGGFVVGKQEFRDGVPASVDYSQPDLLRAAIFAGTVKIGIDAGALSSDAGNKQGWFSFGGQPGQFSNEDHCVALTGYGTAGECFAALGVPLPAGVDPTKPDCFLLFTWSTIGVVDLAWLMSTCGEAWVRSPSTVFFPPKPTPTPPPPPLPPGPSPMASLTATWDDAGNVSWKASKGQGPQNGFPPLPRLPWQQLLQILIAWLLSLLPPPSPPPIKS